MPTNESNAEHEFFMHRCIDLGRIAKKRGESPVGSVVVLNGQIIGEGVEGSRGRKDITSHAETEAVRRATEFLHHQDLSSCTLYSTHEPSIMCSYVIRHSKINTVVMSLSAGGLGGCSSRYPLLTDQDIPEWSSPPKIVVGILKEQSELLLSDDNH